MAQGWTESTWEITNYGRFINQLEKIDKNVYNVQSNVSINFFFHHTTYESMCDTLPSSAANQGDNTVSVA